ncbi:hypothetical protein [Cyclobacterium sp. SYSU L10401]|uniref:hypothetical protein n=1 Tax=Cyclobacterium sp. SYSU L10401 TaxID=2678657 RepID=UPI0013D1A155|nr:hypothetical protein [Cyclobacterium sp. SYSU L10401]
MTKKKSLDVSKLRLFQYEIIHASIKSSLEFEPQLVTGHEFNVNLDLNFDETNKVVLAKLDFTISTKSSKEVTEAKGEFEMLFAFHVENLEELIERDEKDVLVVDAGLSNAIASVSYSTSRGILLTRFQGTALSGFILPIVNPNELLK